VKRAAKCHCGDLVVETVGEPQDVFMCHCELCQRRTGTSYNLGAWFRTKDVTVTGATKEYVRKGESGSEATFYFCPNCGSNVFWKAEDILPQMVGVAVGCFADPEFPKPSLSAYGKRRHRWLALPAGVPSFPGAPSGEPEPMTTRSS
jgi:hypothetical protein